MEEQIRLSSREVVRFRQRVLKPVFVFSTRYADVLVVPWILKSETLYVYFIARMASLCLPMMLAVLGYKVEPVLRSLVGKPEQTSFRAAAARVNLGYLMISGAMALFLIICAPYLAKVIDPEAREILIWLVIGQSAPVLFGATGLLMKIVDRGTFYDVLGGITALMFLVGIVLLGARDGIDVAQTFAVSQLTLAAVSALLLTQCGIWPGLTALFHNQIKLY
jgi:hypothetical protein